MSDKKQSPQQRPDQDHPTQRPDQASPAPGGNKIHGDKLREPSSRPTPKANPQD